ncbi:hypothetical protein [Actinomadura spongiicola]|nr:hypothetical protein [Actinomadura spongiicola]
MSKGNRLGPGLLRLTAALLALGVLAVVVKAMPTPRRRRARKSA